MIEIVGFPRSFFNISQGSFLHIVDGRVVPLPENFERFSALIRNFALTVSQTIKSPTKLAEMILTERINPAAPIII